MSLDVGIECRCRARFSGSLCERKWWRVYIFMYVCICYDEYTHLCMWNFIADCSIHFDKNGKWKKYTQQYISAFHNLYEPKVFCSYMVLFGSALQIQKWSFKESVKNNEFCLQQALPLILKNYRKDFLASNIVLVYTR